MVCACTLAFYTNWFFNSCSAPSRNAHALTQRCDRSVCHCSLHTETLLNDPRPHGSPVLLSSHQIELHHVTSDLCDLTHLKTLLEIRVLFSIFIDFCPSIQVYYICSSHKVQLNARLFIILIIEKRYICSLVFYL